MFSNTVLSSISQLLIGSFLHLQLLSTAEAVTRVLDLSIYPKDDPLPVPASQLFDYYQLQIKKEKEQQDTFEAWKQSFEALTALSRLSWTVNVVATMAGMAQAVTSVVFSPFLVFQELLKKSEEENKKLSEQPLKLEDLLEEKKLIDLGEGTSVEISWDGKVKINQTDKNSSELHVRSLTDVILDNVKTPKLTVNAPSVSLQGRAEIDTLSIGFDGQGTSVFELGTYSVFRTQELDLNGVLLNKGTIDLKDPAKIKAKSLVNLGTLHSEGALVVEVDTLFRNGGMLSATKLDLSANIFDQVALRGKDTPYLKANELSVVATEALNLKTGKLEVEQVELTSLGTFSNKSDMTAHKVFLTSQNELLQSGSMSADVVDVHSFGNMIHNGTLMASKEANFWVGEKQVIDQQGVLQTPRLTLEGENSLFRNTRPLALEEVVLSGSLQFENDSPLTAEEAQGKEEPATQVTIGKLTGSTSSVTNTGFLTIKEGTLGTVHNRGVWISDNLMASDFRQSGRMKASQLTVGPKRPQ